MKTKYYYVTYSYQEGGVGSGFGGICLECTVGRFTSLLGGNEDILLKDAKEVIERSFKDKDIKVVILNWKKINRHQFLEFEGKLK